MQLEANEAALEAEKTRHDLVERVHELEARAIAGEVRVQGAEQSFADVQQRAGTLNVDNERLKEALNQTRAELESELAALRGEHADVMGEVGGLKARNDDLVTDVADLRKRLAMEMRRAEEAEAERDDFRANAEKDSSTLQKKVEAAEKAAEEAIATAEATKNRLVSAAHQERDEAVASAKASKEAAVRAAQEERDEEIAKARAAKERAVEDIRKEMKTAVFEARRDKDEAIAAAHADKDSTTAYLENDRDTRVAKAERDKEEAVSKALRDKEFAIAEAHRERDNAVEEAQAAKRREVAAAERARDDALAHLKSETARLTSIADEAMGKIDGVARALEASRSNENRARKEADRAMGEAAQLREKLETARAEFSERLKEYALQIGDLERGAQVLMVDPTSDHVLRPSQLSEAAQALATDLHRASAQQVAEYRRATEDLQSRLIASQRDVRALHAGYRALRHRFEDLAPLVDGTDGEKARAVAVPKEDEIVEAPPTPAEAREMDARGLAAKLADLKEENARLQQAVRLAALDGRGPLAPGGGGVRGGSDRGGGDRDADAYVGDGDGEILYFDDERRARPDADGGAEMFPGSDRPDRAKHAAKATTRADPDSFNFSHGNENARLRVENQRLQEALDAMRHRRPQTSEEELRRENGKLKVQLAALANMDKTRAQLANEVADLKTRLQEKDTELHETKNHNQRAAFNEQRAAIKEFTERVQAELEKENRHLQTRCAMAEEQIKEINAYMAQSTLAYQKEIMRLRSIIQATAPERLKTPTGLGAGGFASKKAATRASMEATRPTRSGGGAPRNPNTVDAWGKE